MLCWIASWRGTAMQRAAWTCPGYLGLGRWVAAMRAARVLVCCSKSVFVWVKFPHLFVVKHFLWPGSCFLVQPPFFVIQLPFFVAQLPMFVVKLLRGLRRWSKRRWSRHLELGLRWGGWLGPSSKIVRSCWSMIADRCFPEHLISKGSVLENWIGWGQENADLVVEPYHDIYKNVNSEWPNYWARYHCLVIIPTIIYIYLYNSPIVYY